jgi:glycosyltransferase involved in cell wall biosynthesis
MMRRSLGCLHHSLNLTDWLPQGLNASEQRPGAYKPGQVTIVMSTYLRSDVLEVAIQSVMLQTFTHWVLIVVGDGTNRDSAEVVASINDKRIRFLNLAKNSGDQSLPNSLGARLCDTEFLAFLNQDDIWFPNHLSRAIRALRETKSDFYLSSYLRLLPPQTSNGPFDFEKTFLSRNKHYSPTRDWPFVASTWVLRADLSRRIGDWKSAEEIRYASSQEYLYRCWAFGAKILKSPKEPSVLIVPSIHIENSYSTGSASIHRNLLPKVSEGRILAEEHAGKASKGLVTFTRPSKIWTLFVSWRGRRGNPFLENSKSLLATLLYHASVMIVTRLGVSPWEYATMLLGFRKGFSKRLLNRMRGIEPT